MQVLSVDIFLTAVGQADFDALTEDNVGDSYPTLEYAENRAIGDVREALSHRYDLAQAYAQSPLNPKLEGILLDLALWYAYVKHEPQNVPDTRAKMYNDARRDLKAWAQQDTACTLPLLNPEKGSRIRYGVRSTNKQDYPDLNLI